MPEGCIPAEKCSPTSAALRPPGCIPQAAPQGTCPGPMSVKKSLSREPPGWARQSPSSCNPEGLFPSNPPPRAQLEISLPGPPGEGQLLLVFNKCVHAPLCVSIRVHTHTHPYVRSTPMPRPQGVFTLRWAVQPICPPHLTTSVCHLPSPSLATVMCSGGWCFLSQ